MRDEVDEVIARLVDDGALTVSGMYGEEFTYNVNPDRMKEVFPEFYGLFMNEVNDTLLDLMDQGLVSVEYDENLKPWFSITDKGKEIVDERFLSAPPDEV